MLSSVIAGRIKPIAVSTLYYSGFFGLIRLLQRDRLTILMYHRFSEKTEPFKLRQHVFDRQLNFLRKKYSIISFDAYLQVLHGTQTSLPANPLIITIDDGYQDNYEYAFPVLKKHDVPATIFLTTDFVSCKAWLWANRLEYILKNTTRAYFSFMLGDIEQAFQVDTFEGWHHAQLVLFNYCRTLPETKKKEVLIDLAGHLKVIVPDEATSAFAPLTWEQIREMQNSNIGYGSHTCSHSIMSRLSDNELDYELKVSKEKIENNTNTKVNVLCYPNGQPEDISKNVIRFVQRNGYCSAVTTIAGFNYFNNSDPYLLNRITLGGEESALFARNLTRRIHVN